MEINWGSRLLLTSLFQLEAEGRFVGHFKTDYGGQGLEAVRNRRSYSPPSLGLVDLHRLQEWMLLYRVE